MDCFSLPNRKSSLLRLITSTSKLLQARRELLCSSTCLPFDSIRFSHLVVSSAIVPSSMVTAVVESPLRQRQRLRSPLASGGGGGDFEFRHWRPAKRVTGMRRRWAPPEIEIPNGHGGGGRGSYTSLRDIMSSPEYAGKASCSPDEPGSGSGADVHMIRHPLVKHAAYAYLQLTPSAVEERARLRRRRGPLCRIIMGCLGFVEALFGR